MNYRDTIIMAATAVGERGTEIVPINLVDPISALVFYSTITIGAAVRIASQVAVFNKIELVDGSDVLMALSGTEMGGLMHLEKAGLATNPENGEQSVATYGWLSVQFGRKLWDSELAFDPTKFRNPQLKITWDAENVSTEGTAMTLQIMARTFDEKKISPIGFLQNREFKSFTPETGTHEYTALPTDLVLRKLIVQPKMWVYSLDLQFANMRLSEDNDKRVPFDIGYQDLIHLNAVEFGEVKHRITGVTDGSSHPTFGAPTAWARAAVVDAQTIQGLKVGVQDGGRLTVEGAATTSRYVGTFQGLAPYFCLCYPFGDQEDIADWYDPTRIGSLRLDLTGGSSVTSGATTQIILQQLRRY